MFLVEQMVMMMIMELDKGHRGQQAILTMWEAEWSGKDTFLYHSDSAANFLMHAMELLPSLLIWYLHGPTPM